MMYELTLSGFDERPVSTGHLVKWIEAPSEEAVNRLAASLGLFDCVIKRLPMEGLGFDDGLDVAIAEDGVVVAEHVAGSAGRWAEEQREAVPDA